jgi:hypothetical protein
VTYSKQSICGTGEIGYSNDYDGISLLDCFDADNQIAQNKIYDKITAYASKLVETGKISLRIWDTDYQ